MSTFVTTGLLSSTLFVVSLSFFIEREDGSYEREMELHQERTYPVETYLAMLKEAGFSTIEVSADFDQEITGENTRWFFKAQK